MNIPSKKPTEKELIDIFNLPKVPTLMSGVRYPENEIQIAFSKVANTDARDYLLAIRQLSLLLNSLHEAVEYKGYEVVGFERIKEIEEIHLTRKITIK